MGVLVFGSVEVGKTANLVILAANPLDDRSNLAEAISTVKSGQLYDDEGTTE